MSCDSHTAMTSLISRTIIILYHQICSSSLTGTLLHVYNGANGMCTAPSIWPIGQLCLGFLIRGWRECNSENFYTKTARFLPHICGNHSRSQSDCETTVIKMESSLQKHQGIAPLTGIQACWPPITERSLQHWALHLSIPFPTCFTPDFQILSKF